MILQSDLVSLMSASLLGTAAARGLAPLTIAEARFARTIGVLMRKDTPLPPLAERLLELLQATSRLDAGRPRPGG
jgi:DNA-binding transcriptional LysR family regulator